MLELNQIQQAAHLRTRDSQEGRVAVDSVLDLQACVLTWTPGAGKTAEISLLSPDPFPMLRSQETGLPYVLQTHVS